MRVISLILIICILTTCKKKTDIEVKVFNPALGEYVANATVVIVEKKGESDGLFSGEAGCSEIASAVTNADGIAIFGKQKLKTREGYKYFGVVKEAWGVAKSYPCGGYQGSYLNKDKSNDVTLTEYTDGYYNVQYNNLFNPAIAGDSIIVIPQQQEYYDPAAGHNQGGGGGGGRVEAYSSSTTVYPVNYIPVYSLTKLTGKINVYIRKRKMGVVTVTEGIVKAYPNQTTTIMVDW